MTDNTENKKEEVAVEAAAPATEKKAPRSRKPAPRHKKEEVVSEFEERVVAVNRVAKVVKGGRRFSFSALVIVGDKKGRVGYGLGKAKEVPDAIRKASQVAAKKMINVPIENGTFPHVIMGEFDAGKILFKPASEGTGVKAAGACRSILELVGVKNVLTKSLRGSNPHNVVKATFAAFKNLRSVDQVAKARGVETKGLRLSR
jgi:small subunit ribosomal protein S5